MRRLFLFIILAFLLCLVGNLPLFGQISVNADLNPEAMIRDVFTGKGVTVSNITFQGRYRTNVASSQFGTFELRGNDPPDFFNRGIILSTGFVRDAPGPNTNGDFPPRQAPNANGQIFGRGDADLKRLIGDTTDTFDAAVIEFDFIPLSDTLKFRYIFASEEYQEWVDSVYNDVFAFFIRGNEYANYTNIALIPGTQQPVAINSVNHLRNTQFYVSNTCPGTCPRGTQGPFNIQYDGFTTVLEATAIVTPCSTYRFKIAIADVDDYFWDSAVFLDANSFSTNVNEVVADGGVDGFGNDTITTFESCENNVRFVFKRKNTDTELKVPLTLSGTATKDVDYTIDADTVHFQIGQSVVTININVKFDRFVEGTEHIIVNYLPPMACTTLTAVINIVDLDTTLSINTPKLDICSASRDTIIPLKALINNGVTNIFRFQWTDKTGNVISSNPEFNLRVNRDTLLYVAVFDTVCNAPAQVDSVIIKFYYKDPNNRFRSGVKDTFICQGSDFRLESKLLGGRPPYRIEWRNQRGQIVSNNADLNFLNFNKDTVLVLFAEDDLCKQRLIDTVKINLNPPITSTKLGVVKVCPDKNFNINPNVSGSGNFIYEWLNLNTGQVVSNNEVLSTSVDEDTPFAFFVKDSCFSRRDTVRVEVIPLLRWGTITVSQGENVCLNDSVEINVSVFSGTGNYSFEWNTGERTDKIMRRLTNDQAIAVVVRDGCTILDTTFFFNVSKPIVVSTQTETPICAGETATLKASIKGGNDVILREWKNENNLVIGNGQTVNVNPNATQKYIFTAADDCGTIASDTLQVTVIPKPEMVVPPTLESCTGTPLVINALLNVGINNCLFFWFPSTGLDNPFALQPTLTLENAGVYVYKVVPVCNGCVGDTQSVQITINPKPIINFQQNTRYRCSGDNGLILNPTISSGTGNYTFRWHPIIGLSNPNIQNPIANPSQSTGYTLTVTDAKGCVADAKTIWVEVSMTPQGSIPERYEICENTSGVKLKPEINFRGTTDAEYLTFEWNPKVGLNDPFRQDPIANPTMNIQYFLTVTAQPSGCINSQNISTWVLVKNAPVAIAGQDQSICPDGKVQLGVPLTPEDNLITYRWSPATGLSDPNIKQPIASPKHTTKYFVTAEKEGCLGRADSVWVYVNPAPTLAAERITDMCPGDSVQLKVQVGTGFEPYTYEWTPVLGLSDPNLLEPMASPEQTTTYTLQVKTPHCSAQLTDSVKVVVLPRLKIDADASSSENILVVKKGESMIIPAFVEGNSNEFSTEWWPREGLNRTDILQPTVTPLQNTRYFLKVVRANCVSLDSVLVLVNAKPRIIVVKDSIAICEAETAKVEVQNIPGEISYDWQPKDFIVSDQGAMVFVNPKVTSTYTLVTTDNNFGEKDTAEITIVVHPKPTPKVVSSPSVSCENFVVHFSDQSGLGHYWAWDFGDSSEVSNEQSPIHKYTKTGTYFIKLIVRSIYGCEDSVMLPYKIRVGASGKPIFGTFPEAPATLSLPNAEIACLDSSVGAVSWFWEFGDGATSTKRNPTHIYKKDGEYVIRLTITDENGCTHSATKAPINVDKGDITIYNVFTPNNDGFNDTWLPVYLGNLPVEVTVSDRWGIRVFEGTQHTPWDGRDSNGNNLPAGVYFYFIKVGSKFYRGEITLVR